jgi:hypothetical protein
MDEACSMHEGKRIACRISEGKPEGKMPVGRPKRGWELDVREMGRGGMDWIHLAQDTDQWRVLVNMAMNLRVP